MVECRTVKQSCVESIESLLFPSTILVSSEAISRENNHDQDMIRKRNNKDDQRVIRQRNALGFRWNLQRAMTRRVLGSEDIWYSQILVTRMLKEFTYQILSSEGSLINEWFKSFFNKFFFLKNCNYSSKDKYNLQKWFIYVINLYSIS